MTESQHEPRTDEFSEHIENSVEQYKSVTGELNTVMSAMKAKIRRLFAQSEVQPLFITGRVKSAQSFRAKASRRPQETSESAPVLEFPNPAARNPRHGRHPHHRDAAS
ncbi:hypothetical protein AAHB37_08825 [Glutamicibacter halophytocola]|uniref:hypothetical protein n=1 Tax=Glutamicibacter halophytocola TaxID=1933880 RepID=UPI00321A79E2